MFIEEKRTLKGINALEAGKAICKSQGINPAHCVGLTLHVDGESADIVFSMVPVDELDNIDWDTLLAESEHEEES